MVKLLGKFGLDYCDLPTILSNVGVLLRVFTVNIDRRYNKPIPWIFYLFSMATGSCYIYVYVVSVYWYVFVRYPENGNFTSVVVEISLSMCSVNCIIKLFYMKMCPNRVMNLVDEYLCCDELVEKNTRFSATFLKNLKVIKKRATTVWISLFTNSTIYNFMPLLLPGRHFSEDMCVIYGLEPMFDSPNYEIASLMMVTGVYFAVFTVVHITLFIIVIVGVIEAQMLALSEELKNIWKDSEQFYSRCRIHNRHIQKDETRNTFIEIRLQHIVKFQTMNINLKNIVEQELSFIFVVDFVIMIIAILTELIGGLENTFFQMPFTVAQVFMACLIGQRLIDASQVFENAVYSCEWENFNVSNQKTVLLMLQCAQKTLTLSAGGMSVLDLPCLMSVLKFIYSAYATLKSAV